MESKIYFIYILGNVILLANKFSTLYVLKVPFWLSTIIFMTVCYAVSHQELNYGYIKKIFPLIFLTVPSFFISLCIDSTFNFNAVNLIASFYIILLLNKQNFKKLSILSIWAVLIGTVAVYAGVALGIFENKIFIDRFGRYRMSMGFNNANYSSVLFYTILSLVFIIYPKYKYLSTLGMLIVFIIFKSRTMLIAAITLVILDIMLRITKFKRVFIFMVYIGIVTIVLITNFILPYMYLRGYNLAVNANDMLSDRIMFYSFYIKEVLYKPYSILKLYMGGTKEYFSDSSYVNIFFWYGFFFFVVMLFYIYKALIDIDYKKAIWILSVMVYSIPENLIITPILPIGLLFWYIIIIDSNKQRYDQLLSCEMLP